MKLKDILSHKIVGNAMSDQKLMDEIDAFVADESNSMIDRRKALKKLDDVMGVDQGLPSEQEVLDYLRDR